MLVLIFSIILSLISFSMEQGDKHLEDVCEELYQDFEVLTNRVESLEKKLIEFFLLPKDIQNREESSPTSLRSKLLEHGWCDDNIASDWGQKENNLYFGDIPSTPLYAQEDKRILPQAPVIYTYNPNFIGEYVDVGIKLPITPSIRRFLKQHQIHEELQDMYLVMQRLALFEGEPLLRLHGWIHGENLDGYINARAEIIASFPASLKVQFNEDNSLNEEGPVMCHGGIASPNNFKMEGFSEAWPDDNDAPPFQGVWLKTTYYKPKGVKKYEKFCALTCILIGGNLMDRHASSENGDIILTQKGMDAIDAMINLKNN